MTIKKKIERLELGRQTYAQDIDAIVTKLNELIDVVNERVSEEKEADNFTIEAAYQRVKPELDSLAAYDRGEKEIKIHDLKELIKQVKPPTDTHQWYFECGYKDGYEAGKKDLSSSDTL